MSYASQRDCTSETANTTTNDEEMDLEGCFLGRLMSTRLGMISGGMRGEKKSDIRGEGFETYSWFEGGGKDEERR
jgi:hypothetical protein